MNRLSIALLAGVLSLGWFAAPASAGGFGFYYSGGRHCGPRGYYAAPVVYAPRYYAPAYRYRYCEPVVYARPVYRTYSRPYYYYPAYRSYYRHCGDRDVDIDIDIDYDD